MNWVGGARSRVKMKDELSKQKEYFEKKRYQNKVKRFEKPVSPKKRKIQLSTDLLSLQAATFSAKKFSTADSSCPTIQKKVTRVDLDQSKSSLLPFHRLDDVELPMSPGAPSKLLLQEASSSMGKEPVNIIKKMEEDTSNILMTHKDRIKKDHIWKLSSPNRLSQIPEEQYTEDKNMYQGNTMRFPSRPFHNESPAALSKVPHIRHQQHYQMNDKNYTQSLPTDSATTVSMVRHDVTVHERDPEKLFFEFLPQAMSTVKRQLLEENVDPTVHLTSPLSDISYADSLPSTIRDEVESESLVPQINHSSPATTSSSPWETGNLSTSLDMSSDNTEPFSTKHIVRGHGQWSSTAEDTPQLSDSSLTTFRQYYRKKLKGLSKSSTDQYFMTSHDSSTPSDQQKKMDHLYRETHTVSSFQHASNDLPPGSEGVMNVTDDEGDEIQLIDPMEYADKHIDVKSPLKQGYSSFSQSRINPSHYNKQITKPGLLRDDEHLAAPVADIVVGYVMGNKQDGNSQENGGVKTDNMITEWTDFIGGLDEEGTDETETVNDNSVSEDSSQWSCEDDKMNVTNQVLMEVMALDKKMNEAVGNTPGLSSIIDKIPDDCLEGFSQETDPSHNNVTEECTMKSNQIDMKKALSENSAESNKHEGCELYKAETSKELQSVKSTDNMENVADMNSDQHISNQRLTLVAENVAKDPQTDIRVIEINPIKKVCSENDKNCIGNSPSDKKTEFVETFTPASISQSKEGVSPGQFQDRMTQCKIMTTYGTGLNTVRNTDEHRHVGIQTDEEKVVSLHIPKKDVRDNVHVRDNEVQCELYNSTPIETHNRQTSTIAGGRVNGREHKAYGPSQSSDFCLLS